MNLDAAFAPVRDAVESGRIPGAALGHVGPDGKTSVLVAGMAQRLPEPVKLQRGMAFDLASLTKVILTTTELLRLVERGEADLDDPLARALPDLHQYVPSHPIRRLTLRQCLSHQSGLPGVEPVYSWGSDPATLRTLVLQRDWSFGANVYSDINFMLLGEAVMRLSNRTLAKTAVARGFSSGTEPEQAVATEYCNWRGRVMRGQVHDENAFALGGIAGHAGLFGTIDQVLGFASDLLGGRILSAAALAAMREPQSPTRAIGWERRHPGWSGGSLCSPQTIGHTGFTGTGLWIDFERGHAWTLLTNRVHPSRHAETGIQQLRQAVGNLVSAS